MSALIHEITFASFHRQFKIWNNADEKMNEIFIQPNMFIKRKKSTFSSELSIILKVIVSQNKQVWILQKYN